MTECAVSECTTKARKRGWCTKHYQRWWKHGDPEHALTGAGQCTVEGCVTAPRSALATMCEMHYCRVRRNGHTDLLVPQNAQSCKISDCDGRAKSDGLCGMHAERVRKHGDPNVVLYRIGDTGQLHPSWRGSDIGYSGAHTRTRSLRGTPESYPCVDCAGPALQWSYDYADPNVMQSTFGPYSADPMHYQPRCLSCHTRFDKQQHATQVAD